MNPRANIKSRCSGLVFGLIALCLVACDPPTEPLSAQAWSEQVQEAHARAEQLSGRAAGVEARAVQAREALQAALAVEVPTAVDARLADSLRADAWYRSAEMALLANDSSLAIQDANEGLRLEHAEPVFVANLYVIRGRAHERAGAETEAAADYHQALLVSEGLLLELLDSPATTIEASPSSAEDEPSE